MPTLSPAPAGQSGNALQRVVLASQSPRRRELLALIGVTHTVRPADIDESVHENEAPFPHAERLARTKASVVAALETDAVVIGSDTIVVIDDEILGKPVTHDHAGEMLRKLSGRTHTVVTAVAVAQGTRLVSAVEQVLVTFRPLTDEMIEDYISTGEPMDKAGAYGIQGYGATIVERIDGDFFSVMGLPLGKLITLCGELGINYRFGPLSTASRASR
ncbi:MAG: septum formation inhibitor Maf [Phycisphaerae bacterium]|nr:septum formation inhibitor Maf [Gemmatimonadaceae bacterium]